MRHCWTEVPLFRRKLDEAGLNPDSFRGLDDLERIPITDRHELQVASAEDRIARSYRNAKLVIRRTSGSSGVPLEIARDPFEDWLLRGLRLQCEMSHGFRPWHRNLGIIRGGKSASPFRAWRTMIDCLEPMDSILAKLRAANPRVVGGYAGMLAEVAAALTEEDRRKLRIRYIRSGAETLTPAMRQVIEQAFGVPPTNYYASHEFNLIAAECRQTGLLHVAESAVVLEVLREGQPAADGETGEAVVTALHSYAAPFLRYRLGDVVVQGPKRCHCGAPVSAIREVTGRAMPLFSLPDGRKMHPYVLVNTLTQSTKWVRQYQIVQERRDLFHVRVVGSATETQVSNLGDTLRSKCGNDVTVRVEHVEQIRPEANGKFRPYYSVVPE